jgi:hypothetical protein
MALCRTAAALAGGGSVYIGCPARTDVARTQNAYEPSARLGDGSNTLRRRKAHLELARLLAPLQLDARRRHSRPPGAAHAPTARARTYNVLRESASRLVLGVTKNAASCDRRHGAWRYVRRLSSFSGRVRRLAYDVHTNATRSDRRTRYQSPLSRRLSRSYKARRSTITNFRWRHVIWKTLLSPAC